MRDYTKITEYFDGVDAYIAENVKQLQKVHRSEEEHLEYFANQWRQRHYDATTHMFYATCFIHWQGEDGSVIIPSEVIDWFQEEVENREETRMRIFQEDLDDGSMRLSLVEVEVLKEEKDET